LFCAGVIFFASIGQWLIIKPAGQALVLPLLRAGMFIAAAGLLVYDWRVVWPRIWRYRQEYLDNADNPDIANPALDQFDHYQAESIAILRNILFLLLGIILFSAAITAPIVIPLRPTP
jgi:hypothetical protein